MKNRKTIEELDKKYHDRKVVLVDGEDKELGVAGLVEAHRDPGIKHRAFSLVLYRVRGGKKELLLQKRSREKPVFPYYWTNTCCYNMAPGEEYLPRAAERAWEEMGVEVASDKLELLYKFAYYAPDLEGWCENELDTVIVGEYEGDVNINPHEAADYKWMEWEEMKRDMEVSPAIYAPWWKMTMRDGRLERRLGK